MLAEETTNGRTTRAGAEPKVPAWLRAALPALEAVAPPLAARIGERLFLTPPRHPAPERERAALATAVAFDVPFRGRRLRAWRWGGRGAPVLLVHGWGGRAGQMAAFAPPLLDAGLRAVIAHSMGAPSTVLALGDGLALEAAVFVGPSVGPRGFLRLFGQALGLSEATRAAVARRLEARFGRFEEYDVRNETGVMTLPLLVVHDRR